MDSIKKGPLEVSIGIKFKAITKYVFSGRGHEPDWILKNFS